MIVGPDFAPSSLPPALRVRLFATHLPAFGWTPIVLTTDPQFYESPVDPENERLVPESLEVIRTRAIPARVARRIGIGDIAMRSLWRHWKALRDLCSRRKIDLIFFTVPPYASMVLGRLARRRFGIPYVIDYMDPWVTEHYWHVPRSERPPKWPLAYALARVLEPFALRRVSALAGVSRGTTDGVAARYRWMADVPAAEIPYGCEPGDFEYLARNPRKHAIFDPRDGRFHISYIGVCIPSMYPAVRSTFAAIRAGLDRAPRLFERIRVHFVGSSYAAGGAQPAVLALAREQGIAEYVDEHPARVPYLNSLQLILDSRLLLMLGTHEPHYTASKVFSYLAANRPILAIFHEASSVVRILDEAGAAPAITFNAEQPPAAQKSRISERLEYLLSSPEGTGAGRPAAGQSARAMTERLAALFDTVLHTAPAAAEARLSQPA